MRDPTVSVIVPTKNEEVNIVRCLTSVKKQTYKGKIEIIVVDNFSTDKTVHLAKKFTSKVWKRGSERSAQRNFGAEHARGDYLLFLDADMELSRGAIADCVKLAQLPHSVIVTITERGRGYDFWGRALALEKNTYYQGPTYLVSSRFFPREPFLKLGGYDQSLVAAEDWDLTQRFLNEGFVMRITRSSVYHHEPKATLITLIKKEMYYIKNIARYAKKHPLAFSYQGSILYRGFVWIRSWRTLIRHPLLTLGFLWYKLVVWIVWQWYTKTTRISQR
ncbi:glycosyltransferase [Candidatus Microgenomates bacterium]|nr:glycosyltransferase [Candidatus Microgenomates bacterium]